MMQQLNIEYAKKARDRGIEKATASAERVNTGWNDRLWVLFRDYIRGRKKEFLAEDFREAVTGLIEMPPNNRAFGGVIMKAARLGLIERLRYEPVKNVKAHRCSASVWRAR